MLRIDYYYKEGYSVRSGWDTEHVVDLSCHRQHVFWGDTIRKHRAVGRITIGRASGCSFHRQSNRGNTGPRVRHGETLFNNEAPVLAWNAWILKRPQEVSASNRVRSGSKNHQSRRRRQDDHRHGTYGVFLNIYQPRPVLNCLIPA